MSGPSVRGILLREGLAGGKLPESMAAMVVRRHPYLLDGRTPVEVIELAMCRERLQAVAAQLAQVLLPRRFYAHLVDGNRMYVCFPGRLVVVVRGDANSVLRAQHMGARFGIPLRQMRFAEMFDTDHPDAVLPTAGRTQVYGQRN